MSEERAKLRKLIIGFKNTVCADAKAQTRVKAVNTFLNGGHNLNILEETDILNIWDSIFYALWYSEMGRGCEEIIAAVERACKTNYPLTRVGFQTIAKKWFGLDQHRVDKVSHLARHLLVVLVRHQIRLWFKSYQKRSKLGSKDVYCKKLLRRTLNDVMKSFGLCYFLLDILSQEIGRCLTETYRKYNIFVGKFELKANLIVFLYGQTVEFASNIELDTRLLKTYEQHIIRPLLEDVIPNESQLTQILVSLRLYQTMKKNCKKSSSRNKPIIMSWSKFMQEVHENCINGEYFPLDDLPIRSTIELPKRIFFVRP